MWELALATIFDPSTGQSSTDVDLIRRAQTGDAAAFEQIMRLHERRVLATALRLLNGNLADAQDAAQTVFLRLHKHLRRIRADDNLAGWLYRVTANVCLDEMRRKSALVPIEKVTMIPRATTADPESEFSVAERRATLTAGLAILAARERAAIVLRDIEGLETYEVARILGISEATVRSHICSARSKLRKFVHAGGKT
jgi:RNA polymerase sigma-70 factor (ECF subfamily)